MNVTAAPQAAERSVYVDGAVEVILAAYRAGPDASLWPAG